MIFLHYSPLTLLSTNPLPLPNYLSSTNSWVKISIHNSLLTLLSTNPSSSPKLSLLNQLISQNLNPHYTCYLSSTNSQNRCILVVPTTKKERKKKIPTTRFRRRGGDLIFGEKDLALLLPLVIFQISSREIMLCYYCKSYFKSLFIYW